MLIKRNNNTNNDLSSLPFANQESSVIWTSVSFQLLTVFNVLLYTLEFFLNWHYTHQGILSELTDDIQNKLSFCHNSFQFYNLLDFTDKLLTWSKGIFINIHRKFPRAVQFSNRVFVLYLRQSFFWNILSIQLNTRKMSMSIFLKDVLKILSTQQVRW
jgi:hypothetical protein